MANKKNKKKEQANVAKAKPAADSKVESKKAVAKANSKKAAKSKKGNKPGFFAGIKKYFASVRSEMKRVTWPSKKELVNFSVVVCVSLIVVGVAIALVDAAVSEGLVLFSGLRG